MAGHATRRAWLALALCVAPLCGCEPARRVAEPDETAPAPPPGPPEETSPSNDLGPPTIEPSPAPDASPRDERPSPRDAGTYTDPTIDGGVPAAPVGPKCGCPADQRCVIYAIANAPDYGGENFNLFHECVALPPSCGPNACLGCAHLVCGATTPDGGGVPQCKMFQADDPWWCRGGLWDASRCDGHYSCRTF